jgi:hypothetical protein
VQRDPGPRELINAERRQALVVPATSEADDGFVGFDLDGVLPLIAAG